MSLHHDRNSNVIYAMPTMSTPNIGLTDENRQEVISLLNHALADAYLLIIKTKKYHWDIIGPQFMTLHKLWEGHYEALSGYIDEYAERVRMLGGYPVGTAQEFLDLTSISEHPKDLPTSTQMVQRLVMDHETIVRNLRESIDACSEKYHDEGTADFFTGMMKAHEKMAWMLRSFVEGEAVDPVAQENGKAKSAVA